jgi:hypothetical protein
MGLLGAGAYCELHAGRLTRSAVCSVQCAVCSVQCAVCSVQCAVCSVQCAVCSVQCYTVLYSVQCYTRVVHSTTEEELAVQPSAGGDVHCGLVAAGSIETAD